MKKLTSIILILILMLFNHICLANSNDDLLITRIEKPLKSELRKEYSAYEYNITNKSKNRLNILNAQINNGISGNIAYNQSEVSAGKSIGVLWAIMGPVGLITIGIGWLVGLVGTPIAWLIGNNKNKKIRKESIIYTNTVQLGFIEPQENITVLTLVPLGAQPQIKITIYDTVTKDYNVYNY